MFFSLKCTKFHNFFKTLQPYMDYMGMFPIAISHMLIQVVFLFFCCVSSCLMLTVLNVFVIYSFFMWVGRRLEAVLCYCAVFTSDGVFCLFGFFKY